MQIVETITKSAEETKKIGLALGKTLEKEPLKNQALVIALSGDLGAGKTTFIQGLAEGLKIDEDILSPTFVILKEFTIEAGNFRGFYHIDAYRIKHPGEIWDLGFEDLLKNPENIIVVEWAEKIEKLLPKNSVRINFDNLGENKRKIVII